LDEEDIQAVNDTLRSEYLSQGPKLQEFEREVASYCRTSYCLAVSNGTAALHLACLALELKEGDVGWTSPLSFVASANCIRYCGGNVDFVDIDPLTFNMSPNNFGDKLRQTVDSGDAPKVIIPVHFAGQACDMRRIREIADEYGCKVVEDACQALGGKYRGKPIGCCEYSDITVFSLHPVKSITSGEGGLILTNDRDAYETMKVMRAHGQVRGDAVVDRSIGPWHLEMQTEGYNYKITEFQCALGMSQLKKLDWFVSKRRTLAHQYKERLKGLPVSFQEPVDASLSAWHLLVVLVDFESIGKSKQEVFFLLQEKGIHLMVHYYPIHLNPVYQKLGFVKGMFPETEAYYEKAFTLPLHPSLDRNDVDHICDHMIDILNNC